MLRELCKTYVFWKGGNPTLMSGQHQASLADFTVALRSTVDVQMLDVLTRFEAEYGRLSDLTVSDNFNSSSHDFIFIVGKRLRKMEHHWQRSRSPKHCEFSPLSWD